MIIEAIFIVCLIGLITRPKPQRQYSVKECCDNIDRLIQSDEHVKVIKATTPICLN
jgi:hypothetical protein